MGIFRLIRTYKIQANRSLGLETKSHMFIKFIKTSLNLYTILACVSAHGPIDLSWESIISRG